jgi:hypothetical protein
VKTDRFSSAATRAAAILLTCLLLAPGLAAGGGIHVGGIRFGIDRDSHSKKLAKALTLPVGEVKTRFEDGRRALHVLKGANGKPAYLRADVAKLIDQTGKDLDAAIVKVEPSDLLPLQDWVADAFGRVQGELAGSPGRQSAAVPAGLFAPHAVAVVASLRVFPLLGPAKKKPAAPPPDTVPVETSDSFLNEVGQTVSRILFLASNDQLEMKLWVGSTVPHSTFSFWPQGKIKGSTPAPTIIRTDGKKGGVLRGLYVYKATWTEGAVTHLIEYPQPAGIRVTPSERLDLVNGSGLFCCRFDEQYCHAIDDEKECRP